MTLHKPRPFLQDTAALAGSVTILGAPRKVLTKRYSVGPMGQVIQSAYDRAKRFVRQTPGGAESIHDLYALLRQMEPHSQYCIIRGASIAGTNLKDTDRKLAKYGGQFEDVPRHWLMLDLDHVVLPPGTSLLQDPADAARAVRDLAAGHIPELADVSAVVQFTSSAGIAELAETEAAAGMPPRWAGVMKKGGAIGVHVWYWLEVPADSAELTRWAKAVNARIGDKFIDPQGLGAVQPHYTAAPVFEAPLRDPLAGRRTLLIEGLTDTATLDIPAVTPRAPRSHQDGTGQANAGRGYPGDGSTPSAALAASTRQSRAPSAHTSPPTGPIPTLGR
jgi:putative DNA primase/helicase